MIKTADRSRKYEHIVYAVLWLLVLVLPFFNEILRVCDGISFSWYNIVRWWIGLIPFLLLFSVNNFILVPGFLLKNKVWLYAASLAAMLVLFVLYQVSVDDYKPGYRFMGLPMPLVLKIVLAMLLVMLNTVIIVIFKYHSEKEARISLETLRLKDELKFLKAQINPHFFMNMLNNIHAMIELDPVKAQDMTLELSKLMRYVLYEGDNAVTSFAGEVAFLESYVTLMKRRYPASKVNVVFDVSQNPSKDLIVPPMLFVTFVENAFKHGVSYRNKSEIRISLYESGEVIHFQCMNTRHKFVHDQDGGVGLDNVRRRLDILYTDRYSLDIEEDKDNFKVSLTIPGL